MDWKYLNSVTIEELKDNEKDELFNTITWYNCETDTDLTLEKCVTVVKLSQEILKYKAEQVEVLLAELDEIAIKEAEQESKKSEDVKSLRSKRSQSSLEIDDLEDKVKDLRHKLKHQYKINEKQKTELEKLQRKVSLLESDNKDLQNELRVLDKDDTHSDISEAIKDQHKDLIDSIHEKNKQISQLLDEIESTEKENVTLKEKLATLRDELAEATKHFNTESSLTLNLKAHITSQTEKIEKLLLQSEILKDQIQELEEEKCHHNEEVERFKKDIESKIDEWKNLLATKNEEIQRLKEYTKHTPSDSTSIISEEYDKSEINILTKVINEREEKILELQDQLQTATKDIEENTKEIEILIQNQHLKELKMKELSQLVKDLKKQLKTSHNRSQEIQNNLIYAEKLIQENEENFNNLTRMLEDNGQIDTSDILKLNRLLKTQNMQREKQLEDLVKTTNKLQHMLDAYERENIVLREKLGLPEDGNVTGVHSILTKQQKQKKILKQLYKQNSELEEEKIALKLKNKELSTVITNLFEQNDGDAPKDTVIRDNVPKEIDEVDHYKEIVEENAALKKGLQEILDKLHTTEVVAGQEIRSETLEKLLRALDARHVSGWYHPAMRLQAELHTLEGTNSELREQLRLTRLELTKYMESPRSGEYPLIKFSEKDLNNSEIIANLNSHLLTVLNNYKIEETTNKALIVKVEEYRQEFAIIHEQIIRLYKQYAEEKNKFNKQDEEFNAMKEELSTKVDDLQRELDIYNDFSKLTNEEVAQREKLKEMANKIITLNRKCIYLENSDKDLKSEIKTLKDNLLESETNYISKINKLDIERYELLNKIAKIENLLNNTFEKEELTKVQDDLDKLTIKQRDLLKNFTDIQDNHRKEFDVLKESNNMYKKDKDELNARLLETLNKLHVFEETSCNVDNAVQSLTKKLAQSEVNEITERQRGNHINNLYELVKDQLTNSEGRYTELEKFNKEVMRKNLQLQENIKELHDKIINYVDITESHNLKSQCDKLIADKKTLQSEQLNLKEQLDVIKKKDESVTLWNSMKEYEMLNLKHQIVDLQSNSDEKAIIARLSTDVVNARLVEAECRKIIENLRLEIDNCETDAKRNEILLNEERLKNEKLFIGQNRRISDLQHIIKQQRLNYYGSVPLISETHFVDNLNKAFADKHEAFLSLRRAQESENESALLKNQLHKHISILDELKSDTNANNKILQWYQEKKNLQLQELRYKRHAEFKDNQLQQALNRITMQDGQITQLEEELLLAYQKPELFLENIDEIKEDDVKEEPINVDDRKKEFKSKKMFQSEEVQTSIDLSELKETDPLQADVLNKLQNELTQMRTELEMKEKIVEEYKSKITELELNLSLFKTQLGDKQSQIMFYEKHILELKTKLEVTTVAEKIEEVTDKAEENAVLNVKISELQLMISQKEENIINLQSLLKKDRDEHSLAAARTQNELKKLYHLLNAHQQMSLNKENLEDVKENQTNLNVIEQYVRQVHALEHHTTELHSNISTLNSQLLTSQEEILRWKTLANERLQNIDAIRSELEDKYKRENVTYKNECDKWRNEIRKLNQIISSYRESANEVKIDITQLLKDKDDQIHKLTNGLRQLQKEMKDQPDIDVLRNSFEDEKENLVKEYETLRKRFELLMSRERKAREEIRNLRSQLIKRPVLSARSDRSDSSREQQLIKKSTSLEKEVEELKDKLDRQVAINETHRMKVDDDFNKWNKQKQWQQTAEKLKNKLKERNEECDKLQHTCSSYRVLIERLEKEKYSLENRIKQLKNRANNPHNNHLENLEMENVKLLSQIDLLTSKLDMQQHHSGGLAAAMLQEKLEAQERKIAILELSAKCPLDVRTEIERLHNTLANLQKKNLQLEAQNLEINLDVQKCRADTPHLREQIQYLESYVEVLKTENTNKHEVDNSGDHVQQNVETKKVSELERTVFILKRLVEKLQAENKRLNSGSRLCTQSTTNCSLDVLRKDYQHLKEQYGECIQKNARLEQELNSTKNTLRSIQTKPITKETIQTLSVQLNEAKVQLAQKSELLDKVKILLHRAASKEKSLNEEIAALRQNLNASEDQSNCSN